MIQLAAVAITVLAENGASRLRRIAGAFFLVALAADWVAASSVPLSLLIVTACSGTVAATILYIAARDDRYGEDPAWRLWMATIVAAVATATAYAWFRGIVLEESVPSLFSFESSGVTTMVGAFWLVSSGIAILLSARTPIRGTLVALLMTSGIQLLLRLHGGPYLSLMLLAAWLQVIVALAGSFLIVNERAMRDR